MWKKKIYYLIFRTRSLPVVLKLHDGNGGALAVNGVWKKKVSLVVVNRQSVCENYCSVNIKDTPVI